MGAILVVAADDRLREAWSFFNRLSSFSFEYINRLFSDDEPKTMTFEKVLREYQRFVVVVSDGLEQDFYLHRLTYLISDQEVAGKKQLLPVVFSKDEWDRSNLYSVKSLVPAKLYQTGFDTDLEEALQKRAQQLSKILSEPF